MYNVTVEDMQALQNNNYNVFAEEARPILLQYVDKSALSDNELKYLNLVETWNLQNDPNEKGTVCFVAWWDSLHANVFNDELNMGKIQVIKPEKFVLMEALEKNSAFKFVDDIRTPEIETLTMQVTTALKKASVSLATIEKENKLDWGKFKNTTVYHLLKTNAMAFARTGLMNGGGHGIINASQHDHGPSWRMVIEMTSPTNAYGIYPGGQSGNPGSKFYDTFIDKWTKGEYYKLWVMNDADIQDKNIKWKMSFNPN
jgi:penicillin amidase